MSRHRVLISLRSNDRLCRTIAAKIVDIVFYLTFTLQVAPRADAMFGHLSAMHFLTASGVGERNVVELSCLGC